MTVGGLGLSPLAPGSLGALPALGVAMLLREVEWSSYLAVCWFLCVISISMVDAYVFYSERHAAQRPPKDPQEIVIDEFIGYLIALGFTPWSWPWLLAAYVLFRFFDILKPGPIGWVDREIPYGLGIIGDDVLAGLAAGATVFVVSTWLFPLLGLSL